MDLNFLSYQLKISKMLQSVPGFHIFSPLRSAEIYQISILELLLFSEVAFRTPALKHLVKSMFFNENQRI